MRKVCSWMGVAGVVTLAGAAAGQAVAPTAIPQPPDLVWEQFNVAADEDANGANLVTLANASVAVFDGELIAQRTTTPPGMRVLVTEYTFRVHEWFRGGGQDLVTVRETGGSNPDGSGVSTVESHKLATNGRYLVFLKPGFADLLLPISRAVQIMDGGRTVADEVGRIATGMADGELLTRRRPELPGENYLGTNPALGLEPAEVGPPDRASEPLPGQAAGAQQPNLPVSAETVFAALRLPGSPGPVGPAPFGLNSAAVGGVDWNYCGYVTGAHNFACWIPDNNNWAWFNDAEIDWDNLVNYSASGGWLFGQRTSGGNPIRNENPDGNDGRDQAGTPSDTQMINGGYGTWGSNGSPNGITFIWRSGGGCSRITETDAFVNPALIGDELQFRKSMVHEMGHSIGLGHEDRYVSNMVSGTWRIPPNYILSAYYNRADDCAGGRAILNAANGNGASWSLRAWRDIATLGQCHPNWGTSGDVQTYVTTLSTFNATAGNSIQIQRMFVENRGSTAYSGPVDLKIYLSTNETISTGDTLVWSGGWSSFGANTVSNNFALNFTIPSTLPTGDYYIGWILSADESELTSTNNTGIMRRDYNGSYALRTLHVTGIAPANNNCSSAITVGNGSTPFTTVGATTDGPDEPNCSFCCGDTQVNQDVWYRYVATCTGTVTVGVCDADYDSKIAVYAGNCPTSPGTAIACNDDACGTSGLASQTTFQATQGSAYRIRVGGYSTNAGTGTLTISCQPGSSCYANCDNSVTPPVLNVNDFICFQSKFAAGDPYANCDGSTQAPVLNVNDFICFQGRFAAGCP